MESQTVTFRDGNTEWEVGYKDAIDSTRDVTYHGDVELNDFFARPVQITAYTWTPGTTWTTDTFLPWSLYLANKRVSNRMSNYKNFSGNLCLKVLVNGNSFYYGRLMMYYSPLPVSDFATVITAGVPAKMMGSQRMKMFIDPTESQGGIMKLPFIWPYDKVDLTTNDYTNLGYVSIIALNELKHANAAVSPVSITVYAWMENVKLSAPTVTNAFLISSQAGGDEYGDGLVSAPASAVAKMTGKLSSAPMIGKYMKATSVAAGAMSSVAKMFGMSRPVAVDPPVPMIPRYVSGFAITDAADPVAKLTVDSKQELTIDGSVIGVDGGDELALNRIASVESYLTTFAWNVAYVPKTILFAARVGPQHYYRAGTPQYTTVPACCFAAIPFKYWKGTMRYRFQVVSSGFHKGRLLIAWDPDLGATTPETNIQYSKIMDINNERDVTIEVGWGQPRSWLETTELTNVNFLTNAGTYPTASNAQHNGVLTVYVLNDLATPNSVVNNDVQVNVFVSMCDDAEFSAPNNRFASYAPYTLGVVPQSGGDLETAPADNIPIMEEGTERITECISTATPSDLIYMGETISSFRQLIRRYNLHSVYGTLAASLGYFQGIVPDFPVTRGYALAGTRAGTSNNYNPTITTTMNYLAMAFLCYRGGVRNKIVQVSGGSNNTFSTLTAARRTALSTYFTPAFSAQTSTTVVAMEDQIYLNSSSGHEGLIMTPSGVQPVLEVEYPFYTNNRFATCRNGYTPPNGFNTTGLCHYFSASGVLGPTTLNTYVAAAEDSTFMCFQGCMPFQVAPTLS